jgi:NDP-sugar pyrophosphorylase family protein
MIKHLVILAAGRSVRMWPLTEYVPKAMALADGRTLLETTVEKYQGQGMNIHLTVGYKREVLSPFALNLGVNTLVDTNAKGNSWWIYNTLLSYIDEPVMVLTCDSLMDIDLDALEKNYNDFGQPACMLLPVQPKEGFDGDYIHHKNGKIIAMNRTEKTDLYGSGCQVLNPKKITELTTPADDFLDVWSQLMAKEQLFCANFTAENWFTFDTVEQLKIYKALKNQ